MRILVTGREGQVARSLAELRAPGLQWVFAARPDFDLADAASIERAVEAANPDLVISAAAYTAVDQAEDEPDLAMMINGEAPGRLARAAKEAGAPIIHLSTDYVFDGSLDRPYREDDPVAPIGVYGKTKLAGEQAVQASGADYAIVRTAWVYSAFGNNFVKTMLRLAATQRQLSVVSDQIGCPTSAHDIADALLAMAVAFQRNPGAGLNQIYHFAGTGQTSWAGLAEETFRASNNRGGPSADITPIATSDWPTKARRPSNSRLATHHFEQTFAYASPHWTASVDRVVERLLS